MARDATTVRRPEVIRYVRDVRCHDHEIRAGIVNSLQNRVFQVDSRIVRENGMTGSGDPVFLPFCCSVGSQLFPKLVRSVGKGAWGV